MKMYDAYVTVRHRISSVCTQADLDAGLGFEQMVREIIDGDGLAGVTDEFEILSVEKKEREA